MLRRTTTAARPSRFLSFLLSAGGAAFIFPNTSVYPEATQRITTRPGTKTPLCHLFFFFFFFERHLRMSCEMRDLRHVTQLILDGSPKQSASASVDLEPRISQTFLLRDHRDSPSLNCRLKSGSARSPADLRHRWAEKSFPMPVRFQVYRRM